MNGFNNQYNDNYNYEYQNQCKKLKKEIRKDSNINALLVGLFYVFEFVGLIFIRKFLPAVLNRYSRDFQNMENLLLYIIMYIITIPLLVLLFDFIRGKKKNQHIADCYCKPEISVGWVVKWIFISIFIIYAAANVSDVLIEFFRKIFGSESENLSIMPDGSGISNFTTVMATVFFAPILEELLFRVTLYRNIEKYGTWSMIIISGITFGLWHTNYEQTLYAAVMGVCSCFLIAKTRSVFPSMIIHFIMNTTACISVMFLSEFNVNSLQSLSDDEMTGFVLNNLGAFSGIGIVLLINIGMRITGLVLFIIELVKHRDSFILGKRCPELSTAQKVGTYLTAPVTIIVLIFLVAATVFERFI